MYLEYNIKLNLIVDKFDKKTIMKIKFLFLFLILKSLNIQAASVDTLKIKSFAMNKLISNLIILPEAYTNNGNKFSVLYLLHGAGDDYKGWVSKVPAIKEYADLYNFIIVCPDGEGTSWYFDSPIDPKMQFETYISKELIRTIDQKYSTLPQKNDRAITGLSMGGHGALYLALKHPDIWGAAGSMSGGVDFRSFPNNWDIAKRLGSYAENKDVWEKNTVINMLDLLKGQDLKIIFDCGTDDFFYDANRRLHLAMLEKKIPHDYTERPGAHDWNYWTNAIKYQLLFFDSFFKNN